MRSRVNQDITASASAIAVSVCARMRADSDQVAALLMRLVDCP